MNSIVENMPIEVYHGSKEYISATGLKRAKKSLKDFRLYLNGYYDSQHKSHFDFGNAFEVALLDSGNFDEKVTIFNEDERPEPDKTFGSTKNKEWKAEKMITGKYVINYDGKESFRCIEEMLRSCHSDAIIKRLIQNIEYQYSLFWTDENGLKLKSRPDICKVKKNIIVDLKTTDDGSPEQFSKDLSNYDYPFQAVMQIDGAVKTGFMPTVDEYYWLVVEKCPPFSATLYRFDKDDIDYCMGEYEYTKRLVAECFKTNIWPSYSQRADNPYGILTAKLPLWYRNYGL